MTRIPDDLHDRYAAWRWDKAYDWVADRPTFRLTDVTGEVRYLKVHPVGSGIPDEATRLRWAAGWVRVPILIEYGSDGFRDWLMTAELAGQGAAQHPWRQSDPDRLAKVLGRGLRAFHEAVPVDECPFWAPGADAETVDRVVCHGDYRLPNAFLEKDEVTGYLALGSVGVADRWSDLAVALTNIDDNLGPRRRQTFLDGYGIAADEEKLARYAA
jgi:kanamycin kinase